MSDIFSYQLFFEELKLFLLFYVILFSNFILIIVSIIQILFYSFTNSVIFLLNFFLLILYLFLSQGPNYMKNQYFDQLDFILLRIWDHLKKTFLLKTRYVYLKLWLDKNKSTSDLNSPKRLLFSWSQDFNPYSMLHFFHSFQAADLFFFCIIEQPDEPKIIIHHSY